MLCEGIEENDRCATNAVCTETICTCENGFFKAEDFLLVVEDANGCAVPTDVIRVAYASQSFIILVAILGYLLIMRNVRQFKRYLVFFLCILCAGTGGVLKAVDPGNRFYGDDIYLTALFAASLTLMPAAIHVSLKKLLWIQYSLAKVKPDEIKMKLKVMDSSLYLNNFAGFITGAIFLSTAFVEDNTGQILMRVGFGSYAINLILLLLLSHRICSMMIKDLGASPSDMYKPVRKRITKYRTIMDIGFGAVFVMVIFPAVSKTGLEYFVYIDVAKTWFLVGGTVITLLVNRKSRKQSQKSESGRKAVQSKTFTSARSGILSFSKTDNIPNQDKTNVEMMI